MIPVGLPDDEETSACLCMEIRKASTPISPILFPAEQNKVLILTEFTFSSLQFDKLPYLLE